MEVTSKDSFWCIEHLYFKSALQWFFFFFWNLECFSIFPSYHLSQTFLGFATTEMMISPCEILDSYLVLKSFEVPKYGWNFENMGRHLYAWIQAHT